MTAPALAQATDYGRGYLHPLTGEFVPSVTTAIKMIHKEALEAWKLRTAAKYADQNWDYLAKMGSGDRIQLIQDAHLAESTPKADLGTVIHEVCDNWIKGVPSESAKETKSYVTSFTQFLMDYRPRFITTEVTIWSRSAGYAGTADAIAEINDRNWILDWKTGRGVYPEYALQMAALRNGDFIIDPDGTEREMPRIDFSGVVQIRPRSYKFFPIMEDEACFSAFLGALEIFRWQQETAEFTIGEPM